MSKTQTVLPFPPGRRPKAQAPFRITLLIVGVYLLIGYAWIIGSDSLLALATPELKTALTVGIAKGLVFITVTALLLGLFLYWHESMRAGDQAQLLRLLARLEDEVQSRTAEVQRMCQERVTDADSRYRTLFNNHHTVMLLIDPVPLTIIEANPAAAEFYGFTLEELRQAPLAKIDPTPPNQLRKTFERALLREHEGFRLRHRLADGTIRDVEMFAGPVRHNERDLVFAIFHDITERLRSEDLLRIRTQVLEATANLVTVTDAVGRIVWVNHSFEKVTGYSLEESLGKTPGQLLKSGQHDAEFYRNMWETILRGDTWSGEIINRKKDGSLFTESMVITPVRDATHTITHFIAVNQDITEKKELEKRFLRAQRLESIGELAGGIAHDINNILAPILLSVGLLKTEPLEPRLMSVLDTIESSAARGAELIRQILSFARGLEGKRMTIDLRHLFRELDHIVRETFPKNIHVEVDCPSGLPLVHADVTQIHQVFMNLMVNARDAMPDGGTLSISLNASEVDDVFAGKTPGAKPGHYLMVTVQDTGHGMTPDVVDRMFEPFFTTKATGHGTGLGLATTHTIVKSHGGFITVTSTPGEGSTFKVYLPVASKEDASTASPADQGGPSPSSTHSAVILVVDDEPPILELARLALTRFGYRVLTATNGAEAVEIYARQRDEIDLVLMDLAMPVMDGHAAIYALRAINPRVVMVASSGHASPPTTDLNVNAFLPKPYSAETLVETLEGVLASAAGSHTSRHISTIPASRALARSVPPDNAAQ